MGSETRRYGAVLVANGHHWDARWPEPAFPGADEFAGEQIHAHEYREPDDPRGQARPRPRDRQLGRRHRGRVLADRRRKTFLATRRGAYVIPKYLNGKPIDEIANSATGLAPIPVAAGRARSAR